MSSCPYCGSAGAYNSGFTVECANTLCRHFTVKQASEFVQSEISTGVAKAFVGTTSAQQKANAGSSSLKSFLHEMLSSFGSKSIDNDIKVDSDGEAFTISCSFLPPTLDRISISPEWSFDQNSTFFPAKEQTQSEPVWGFAPTGFYSKRDIEFTLNYGKNVEECEEEIY